MSLSKLVAFGLVAFLPALAQAELDCIVATREEGFDASRPGAEAVRRAARAVASIVQKNGVFMAGNEPVRVRTSISYYGDTAQAASVITTAYNQKAWTAGACSVSEFADRGGGLSEGTIAVYINDTDAHFAGRLGDAELVAHAAPEQKGQFAHYPVFGAKGDDSGPRVLLSAGGYRPWVPVTVADMLAWRERELARDEGEWQRASRGAAAPFDEAKIEEMYQNMKKVNAAEAEKLRAQMLASLPKMRADAERQQGAGAQAIATRRASFDAYRASFTLAQLAAQGYLGSATTADGVTLRVDDAKATPLARIDPAYAARDPSKIHLVTVSLAPQPKTDVDYEWHHASLQALDIAALAALVD